MIQIKPRICFVLRQPALARNPESRGTGGIAGGTDGEGYAGRAQNGAFSGAKRPPACGKGLARAERLIRINAPPPRRY